MSLEYEARAVGISDTQDGRKMLCFRTTDGRTIKIVVHANMADLVSADIAMKELNPILEPCA